MPNWVDNRLTVKASDMRYIVNDIGLVDFNILLPVPEALKGVAKESPTNEAAIYAYMSNNDNICMDALRDPSGTDFGENKKNIINTCREILNNPYDEDPLKHAYDSYMRMMQNQDRYGKTKNDLYDLGYTLYVNYANYGACTAFDWQCENWGTKWTPSETSVTPVDGDRLLVLFKTAWCAPDKWLKALADKNVFFVCDWTEETGDSGQISFSKYGFISASR